MDGITCIVLILGINTFVLIILAVAILTYIEGHEQRP